MTKHYRTLSYYFLTGMLFMAAPSANFAQANQDRFFIDQPVEKFPKHTHRSNLPTDFRAVKIDVSGLQSSVIAAPMEGTQAARMAPLELLLPKPTGGMARFKIFESPVMAPALAAKYPQIKTYAGHGIDDPTAALRFDISPNGLHAQVLSAEGDWYIDPFTNGNNTDHMSYRKADLQLAGERSVCHFNGEPDHELAESLAAARIAIQNQIGGGTAARSHGTHLRTYRLALACTGEYAATKGGTVAGALAGMVTSMNRVGGIYEKELAIRMVLIPNNDTLIFLNSATDPYTNNNGGTMLGQNQTTIDNRIGNANYDIGHVFSTGGGGIAGFGVTCRSGQKARGVTGSPNPTGDPFDVDYVAHEIGHQFAGSHTFNGSAANCSGNLTGQRYEPGSGSTIMAYAGICPPQNLQNSSNAYFHTASFDEMVSYVTQSFGNTCPVITLTGNTPPEVSVGTYHTIPYRTPFKLQATATDQDNDALTYCFEQYNTGPSGHPNSPVGNAPIFRSWSPTTDNFRYFPRLTNIILNNTVMGEQLPTYERSMLFRVTARDNRAEGGGVTYNDTPITVYAVDTGEPFIVTNPNTQLTWGIGHNETVTWNVAGSDQAPIYATHVHILLSLNGGQTFTDTLAAYVPNVGFASVVVPNIPTTTARIIVAGADNVFFDMSNTNFTIAHVSSTPNNVLSAIINIYPNPTESEFMLSLPDNVQGEVTVSISDMVGRQISTRHLEKDDRSQTISLDLGNQPKGTYLVQISTDKGTAVKRIVKL